MSVLIVLAVVGIVIFALSQITRRQNAARRAAKPLVTVEEFDRLGAEQDDGALPMGKLVPAERDTAPERKPAGRKALGANFRHQLAGERQGRAAAVPRSDQFCRHPSARVSGSGGLQVFENDPSAPGERDPGGGLWWRPHLVWHEMAEGGVALAGQNGWEDEMDAIRGSYGVRWVGGHPSFVQEVSRHGDPEVWGHGRGPVHLGWDDFVTIGDGGAQRGDPEG